MRLFEEENNVEEFKPFCVYLGVETLGDASKLYTLFNSSPMLEYLNVSSSDAETIRDFISTKAGKNLSKESLKDFNSLSKLIGYS